MWNRAAPLLVTLAISAGSAAQAAPAGNSADWTWLRGSAEATPRWDQCAPITWSAPDDGSNTSRALTRGIRKLGRFTGYTFVRVPSGGQITLVDVAADDPTLVSLSASAYADIHSVYAGDSPDGPVWSIASAEVRIGVQYAFQAAAYENVFKVYTLPIVLHELGHIMGLGHAASADQSMMPDSSAKQYGAGDRAGLATVKPATCTEPIVSRGQGGESARRNVA